MKALELHGKHVAELETEVGELLKAHFKLRMLKASQQLNNHTQLGKTKRDIARVKTRLAQKNRQDSK